MIDAILMYLTAFSALIWMVILLLPWQPWRNHILLRIPQPGVEPSDLNEVTVVIPARNEAQVIKDTLAALADQGNGLKVILVDDGSTDDTASQARSIPGLDLQIVDGQPLPEGWMGKVWALEQGRQRVLTRYTLLLDADIQLDPGVIEGLLEQARRGFAMVSVMASLNMKTGWEKLLMPAFIYFFKMLYPFKLTNSAIKRFASAAGGCVLLETRLFFEFGGFTAIRGAVIDDCALALKVKQTGARTWIGQSRQIISIRPYERLSEIWNMIARSAFTQLGNSPMILAICTLGLMLLFLIPVAGLFLPNQTAQLLSTLALAEMFGSYIPTLLYYELSPAWTLGLPLVGALYLGMTWSSAWRYWRGERTRWKGRVYRQNPNGS